jgi:hypothetical protein
MLSGAKHLRLPLWADKRAGNDQRSFALLRMTRDPCTIQHFGTAYPQPACPFLHECLATNGIFAAPSAPRANVLRFFTGFFLLCRRRNISNSFPVLHLLREWASRAVRIVLHAKVLVNLKQPLLVCDSFQKFFMAWIASEKTRRPCFESTVRQVRWELCVFSPDIFPKRCGRIEIVRQPKREQDISEDIGNARFADQRHFFWRRLGGERVVKIPKRMIQ